MRTYAAVFLFLAPAAAAAQDVQVSGHAGWGGFYRRGEWTPVTVDLDNTGRKPLETTVLLCWAHAEAYQDSRTPAFRSLRGRRGPSHRLTVRLPEGSRKSFSLTLLAPDQDNLGVWAYALDDRGRILSGRELPVRPLEPGKRLLAIAGRDRPAGTDLASLERCWVQPDRLPEDWRGYASLGALLWLDADAARFRTQAQIEALRTWISSGGHLIVARGNTAGLSGTALADLLPVALGGTTPVEHLDALGAAENKGPQGTTVVLQASVRRGRATVVQDSLNLVVEETREAGRITFMAFDPSLSPFYQWAAAPGFWIWVLGPAPKPFPDPREGLQVPLLIGSDALTRIAAHFPGVTAPAMGRLFVIIVLFLAVTGPADYLVLRLLRRLEVTWITFPAVVLVFTALILSLGAGFLRNTIHRREIAVTDHYADSSFIRRRAIEAILAPKNIAVSTPDAEPISSNFLTQGVFESETENLENTVLWHSPGFQVQGWGLQRGATGLAFADACTRGPSPLTYTIDEEGADGASVTLRHEGKSALQGGLLVTGSGVYELGAIPPGRNTQRGPRRFQSAEDLARNWRNAPLRQPSHFYSEVPGAEAPGISLVDYLAKDVNNLPLVMPEPEMNAIASRLLVELSFPASDEPTHLNLHAGFARSLNAVRWIRDGGTVLLAWAEEPEPPVSFDPVAGRRTAVVLKRFFQGPPK